MRRKYNAQITIEAAIVIPIVMLIVVSLIYLSMYIHDVVAIRAYAYGAGNEYAGMEYKNFNKYVSEKIAKTPVFIISPRVSIEEQLDSYQIHINGHSNINIPFVANLTHTSYHQENIEIEKNMSKDIIYIAQVILNELKEKGEQ